ncbi:MAG: UDP-N-acetylmuramate dehydrogenase [Candidatus Sungbacteria bacterium]|nr:UDP-N-acetylmuramate dehydrogenase [Candidatus Sungbacteria bacterium]
MSIIVQEQVSLAPLTIYNIGGPCRYLVQARDVDELKEAIAYAARERVPFFLLGAGSNMLVADQGFPGVAIRMTSQEIKVEGERLIVDAGIMMARAVLASAQAGLAGFAWGIGIPGTVGGSVRGNAGCFGGEMGQVVESVRLLEFPISNFQFPKESSLSDQKLPIREINNADCQFNYRDSIFKRHPEWVILSATLKLVSGDKEAIRAQVASTSAERVAKQDIGTKSCGCIFKNTAWGDAGVAKEDLIGRFPALAQFADRTHLPVSFLIDKAGLKGTRIGHAIISPKHANFFVNQGGATAADIRALIMLAKERVKETFGVAIEEEIQYIGF